MNSALDALITIDHKGFVVEFNPAAEATFGYSRAEAIGRPLATLIVPPELREAHYAGMARFHTTGEGPVLGHRIEIEAMRADGSRLPVELAITLVKTDSTPLFTAAIRDISERKRAEEALRESEERTRAIVNNVMDGIITINACGVIQTVNPVVEQLFGYHAADLIGQTMNVLTPDPSKCEIGAYLTNYFCEDKPEIIGVGWETKGRRKNGTIFPLELSIGKYSLTGTLMFAVVLRDITHRTLGRQRLAAERDVARAFAEFRTLANTSSRIIEAIAGNLGWEAGALWLVDDSKNMLKCVDFWNSSSFPCPDFEAASCGMTLAKGVSLPGHVWASGKVSWLPELAEDGNSARVHAAAINGLNWGIAFPLKNGEKVIGVVEFYRTQGEDPEDLLLQMFESITSQVGKSIELRNADQRISEREAEIAIARRIQHEYFPKAHPSLEGFSIAGASRPAQETGGDYFDFIPFSNGHLMIPLGDVSGHGLGAAMIMAETRAYIRALTMSGLHLGTILNFTNSRLSESNDSEHFVTLFLALLNPHSRSMIYSNAGQGPGYILDRHGEVRTIMNSTDIPLGIDPQWAFCNDTSTMLQSGDLVLLMTDGILEACSSGGEQFGAERAVELVRRHRDEEPGAIIEYLIQEASAFCGGIQLDDMTAVVIKVD